MKQNQEKQQFLIVVLIVFLGFLGISIPYLIFPGLFLNLGYSILDLDTPYAERTLFLGITLAAYPLGQFIGAPILGSLSDDYGRKWLISSSLLFAAFFNLLAGMSIEFKSLFLLIFSRFMSGFMEGNIAIARAIAADLKTLSKHVTFGKINAAASIAFLIGPLVGGLMTNSEIVDFFTVSTPFYLICILFLALSIFSAYILIAPPPSHLIAKEKNYSDRFNLFKRLRALFKNARLKYLLISSTLFTLAVDIFYEFGPVYLTIKWSLSPSDLVVYNAVLCFCLVIGNGWLPNLIPDHFSKKLIILYSMISFALALVAVIVADSSLWMLFLFGLTGLLIGLAVTLLTVKISNTVDDAVQGEVMGTQVSLRVLGDAGICLFGGILLFISPQLILSFSVVIAILGAGYYFLKS